MKNNFKEKKWLQIISLLLLIVLFAVIFFKIIYIFLVPIILAVTMTSMFYFLYKKWVKLLRNKRTISSLTFCLLILIVILVPLYFIGHLTVLQMIDLYKIIEKQVTILNQDGNNALIENIKKLKIFEWFKINDINIQSILKDGIQTGGKIISILINTITSSVLEIITTILLTIYIMFYFFRDGDIIIEAIRHISPLKKEYEERIINRFSSISRATMKSTLVIGVLQGIVGTITLLIFGVKGWILWGVIMTILSIIPIVGSYLVMIPVAIYKFIMGDIWQGIIILIVAIVLNYLIDYLLRPILIGKESKLHDLLVFLSTIGGIAFFGVTGFIIGPVIAMIFITLLNIYTIEFKSSLDEH